MDFNEVEDSTAFYLKFLKALMVSEDLPAFLQEADELGIHYQSVPLLEMLRDLVKGYTYEHSLPPQIADCIYNFVGICRFIADTDEEDRKLRWAVCNEILGLLNESKGKEEYPFYPSLINHFYSGKLARLWNHLLYQGDSELGKQKLDTFTNLEYYILYSHTELLDEEEFLSFICDFLLNGSYLEIVQSLMRELPKLKQDAYFLKRVRRVLTENENLKQEYEGNPTDSEYELDEDDDDIVKRKSFWRLHNKVKRKVASFYKDS